MTSRIKIGEVRVYSQAGDTTDDIIYHPDEGQTYAYLDEVGVTLDQLFEKLKQRLASVEQVQQQMDDSEYQVELHLFERKRLCDVTHRRLTRAMLVPESERALHQRQVLIWTGKPGPANGNNVQSYPPIPVGPGLITKLYTLYEHNDQLLPPDLPYVPVHLQNAFIEDQGHDWSHDEARGLLRYYSRVSNEAVWLLAIVED